MSGQKLFRSWGLNISASLDCLGLLATMVRVDCVTLDEAGVGEWVHTRWGNAGRYSLGKQSSFDFDFEMGAAKTRKNGACAGAVGMETLDKDLTCLGVRDGSAVMGSQMAGKHRVTNPAAATVIS